MPNIAIVNAKKSNIMRLHSQKMAIYCVFKGFIVSFVVLKLKNNDRQAGFKNNNKAHQRAKSFGFVWGKTSGEEYTFKTNGNLL